MINELIPLNKLDVEPEVKQLFIDVFRKDPTLRPSAVELLNRPITMNVVEYGRYFDECYNSEDAEELEPASTTGCGDNIPITELPQQISLTSSSGQELFHSIGDEVSELLQLPCNQKHNRGTQDSGVGGDLDGSESVFDSQMSMRSLNRGSNNSNNQQRLLRQDSGLEDMIGGECSQRGPGELEEEEIKRGGRERGRDGRERKTKREGGGGVRERVKLHVDNGKGRGGGRREGGRERESNNKLLCHISCFLQYIAVVFQYITWTYHPHLSTPTTDSVPVHSTNPAVYQISTSPLSRKRPHHQPTTPCVQLQRSTYNHMTSGLIPLPDPKTEPQSV